MPKKDPALKVIPMGGLDGMGKNMKIVSLAPETLKGGLTDA